MLATTVVGLFCNSLQLTTACTLCGATAGPTVSTRNVTFASTRQRSPIEASFRSMRCISIGREPRCGTVNVIASDMCRQSEGTTTHHTGHHCGHTERLANCSLNLESHPGQPSTERINAGGIVECNPFPICLDPSERHLEVPVDARALCSCYEGGRGVRAAYTPECVEVPHWGQSGMAYLRRRQMGQQRTQHACVSRGLAAYFAKATFAFPLVGWSVGPIMTTDWCRPVLSTSTDSTGISTSSTPSWWVGECRCECQQLERAPQRGATRAGVNHIHLHPFAWVHSTPGSSPRTTTTRQRDTTAPPKPDSCTDVGKQSQHSQSVVHKVDDSQSGSLHSLWTTSLCVETRGVTG